MGLFIMKKIFAHCDFSVKPVTIIAMIVALLSIPAVMFLPERFGWENGILENTQMVVLFFGIWIAVTAKSNKKFFYFSALVLVILILREVNCGRTIFFPVPGEINEYYRWKDIKYGWLAHPLYGLYMAYVAVYFIIKKAYLDLIAFVKMVKLPVWNILLMLIGMTLGMYAEKVLENCVFEECAELLFYVSLVGIIWIYTRKRVYVKKNPIQNN